MTEAEWKRRKEEAKLWLERQKSNEAHLFLPAGCKNHDPALAAECKERSVAGAALALSMITGEATRR